ncbi:ATP-binding protein [Jiella mangrovi]|uniref:ATP-binding protein n=1 Tax=Jiella mangrovi TaxID=2821407 RepID=A0ABS4BG82_9HYPH|nr:ATP-binding protein [Jiella mangrovi]MBP0615759.1 ATP-binding protein [Jiella mangrovi]
MPKWDLEITPEEALEDEAAVLAALDNALASLDALPQDYERRLAAAKGVYIGHAKRDGKFKKHFAKRLTAAKAQVGGKTKSAGEYLTVLGSSGSGKTTMTRRIMEKTGLFDPIELPGRTLRPAIRIQGPRPFTSGQLAISILRKVKMATDSKLDPNHTWQIVRNHLPRSRTALIVIDEAQHALRHSDPSHSKDVRDAIKILAEDDEWPVSFVFVGIPIFERFVVTDNEVKGRNTTFLMPDLKVGNDDPFVEKLLAEMLTAGELSIGEMGDHFTHRLIYAGGCQFGRCQKLIRIAIESALINRRDTIQVSDFAEALRERTGCDDDHNTFLAPRFELVRHWISDPELETYVAEDDILVNDDERGSKARKVAEGDSLKRKRS